MNPKDYKDLGATPDAVASTTRSLADAVQAATLLRRQQYPPA
jgi:hypothetical protein